MKRSFPSWAATLLSVSILLSAWLFMTLSGKVSDLFMPGPDELWSAFIDLVQNGYKSRTLIEHIGDRMDRVFVGSSTGAVAGTALGLAMGVLPLFEAFCAPYIEFLRPLPQLAYLVLLIVWFGIGETSKIVLLFLTALPVSAVAARDGVRNVSLIRVQAAQTLGADGWQVFRYVVFPSALSDIFAGARLAIGLVFGTLIAAELIASSTGIGWMILDAGRFLRSDYVFIGIVIIGVLGILIDRLLLLVERKAIHWTAG